MASSDTTKMAEIDTFVIPQQYAPLMMMFGTPWLSGFPPQEEVYPYQGQDQELPS